MSLEDNFDKLMKDKMSEAEFPFDEGNWEKASRMIDAERAAAGGAKSSKYFLLFGSLFLVIAGVTMFSISIMNSADSKNTVAANSENTAFNSHAGDQQQGVVMNNENANSVNPSIAENNAVSHVNGENASYEVSENNSPVHPSLNPSENRPAKVSDNNSHSNNQKNNSNDRINTASNFDSGNGNDGDKRNGIAVANFNASEGKTAKAGSNSAKKNGKAQSSLASTMHQNHAVKNAGTNGKKKNNVSNDVLSAGKNAKVELGIEKQETAEETADYLEMRKSVLQIWKKDEVLRHSGYDFIRKYDEDYFVHKRPFRYCVNIEMGATYLMGWQTNHDRDGMGVNFFAGANFGTYLGRKLIVSAGVQGYNVSHISQPFYSRAKYQYDFGYTGNNTEITTNSLFYVAVPVKFSYPVYKKITRIGLGVNTGYLVSGVNTVKTYQESDQVQNNVVENRVMGTYEGVNKWNVMITPSITQKITNRLCLNGELLVGLTDTYKNNVSNEKLKERNIGARVSLTYDLIHY